MKKLYFLFVVTLLLLLGPVYNAFSQAPEGFTYQAEARDSRGRLLANTTLSIKANILEASSIEIWKGEYTEKTDKYGLFTIVIGDVGSTTSSTGNFSDIDWGNGIYSLQVQVSWGTNTTSLQPTQLLSVPYALYSKTSANAEETKAYVDNLVLDVMNMLARSNENFTSTTTGIIKDTEGNNYTTIKIGSQWWMAENLKTTKYNDGTAIPNVTVITDWAGLTDGAYCWYDNDETTYKAIYGALYNGYAVNTGKLCPVGWHVPSDAEWTTLFTYLGGESVAGGKMKETGISHWTSPNSGATNESGFTGLPGSFRNFRGYFTCCIGSAGEWWTTTPQMGVDLSYLSLSVRFINAFPNISGLSVRCVRD